MKLGGDSEKRLQNLCGTVLQDERGVHKLAT